MLYESRRLRFGGADIDGEGGQDLSALISIGISSGVTGNTCACESDGQCLGSHCEMVLSEGKNSKGPLRASYHPLRLAPLRLLGGCGVPHPPKAVASLSEFLKVLTSTPPFSPNID